MRVGYAVIGNGCTATGIEIVMRTYLRDQVDWPQAFPAEEYAARRARVCAALAEANLDAIYTTAPANVTWLTGYDMIDFHL